MLVIRSADTVNPVSHFALGISSLPSEFCNAAAACAQGALLQPAVYSHYMANTGNYQANGRICSGKIRFLTIVFLFSGFFDGIDCIFKTVGQRFVLHALDEHTPVAIHIHHLLAERFRRKVLLQEHAT